MASVGASRGAGTIASAPAAAASACCAQYREGYLKRFAMVRVAPFGFMPAAYDNDGGSYEVLRPAVTIEFARETVAR